MPARLLGALGACAAIRGVMCVSSISIAPDRGPNGRPLIVSALQEAGVETRLGFGVEALDGTGVVLTSGERIEVATVIWAAGLRASPLTQQIEAERDRGGRLVDRKSTRLNSSH